MSKTAVATRVLPVLFVAAVLAASLLVRPTNIPFRLTACSYGYGGAPTITGISPASGSTSGGQAVTITGCGFTGTTAVNFGATAAAFSVTNDSTIAATSPAHVAGVVDVSVTTPAGSSATSAADKFTYGTACNAVTISANPASPQLSGTQEVFTAVATGCPSAGPLYEFWMRAASQTSWQLLQAYSTTATYNWNSTGAAAGGVYFGIWAKDAGSATGSFDANNNMIFTVSGPCGALTPGVSPASINQGSGTHVSVTGSATCAHSAPLYEFWLRTATSAWILVRSYAVTGTYDWDSTGSPYGTIYFGVWVKDAASGTSTFDSNASITVTVVQAKCTTVTLVAAPTSVTGGVHSVLTAAASGCLNATGQLYEFWLRTATGPWIMVQGYSTTATYDWNSTGAPVGTITFGVWAKDSKSSTSSFDINNSATVAVT